MCVWPVSNVQELFIDAQFVQRCMHSFLTHHQHVTWRWLSVLWVFSGIYIILMLPIVIIFLDASNKKDAVTDTTTALLNILNAATVRIEIVLITHIFTIPLTSTNNVSRSNGIEVPIRRVINSVPHFIEFDARIISLKHQYPVEHVEFQKPTGKPCKFQREITCL